MFVGVNGYGNAAATFDIKLTTGGAIPTSYVFNADAAKLYKVHMDVDYISESPTQLDGNLGSTINAYTHHDRYDYILELDAAGKIIGGEWIGDLEEAAPGLRVAARSARPRPRSPAARSPTPT